MNDIMDPSMLNLGLKERQQAESPAQAIQALFVDYLPFLDVLPNKFRLLDAVNKLACATDFEACERAAKQLFVDVLRFDDKHRDVSSRFPQAALKKVVQLASFGDFIITLVERGDNTPYASPLAPVFKTYPYGLVVTMTPNGQTIRVNFQRAATAHKTGKNELHYRTLSGQPLGREAGDNLLMWAKRFSQFTPAFGDDAQALREKAHVAFGLDPKSAALTWQSRAIDHTEVPGHAWESAAQQEVRELLQTDTSESQRFHWGLQAALRNRFPIRVARGKGVLEFDSYEITDFPAVFSSQAPGRSETRAVTCNLYLRCTLTHKDVIRREILTVPCRIPVPDEHGIFTIDGVQYAYHPELDERGEYFRELVLDEEDLVEAFVAATDEDPDTEPEDNEDSFDELPEELEASTSTSARSSVQKIPGYSGASIRGLLEYLIERMLGGIAVHLWRYPAHYVRTSADILSALAPRCDQEGRLRIVAEVLLRSALTVVSPTDSLRRHLRIIRQHETSTDAHPPAWACLELSAALPAGHWYPVSAARLHPSGGLCIPISHASDTLLAVSPDSALNHNARVNSAITQPAHWWIADPLTPWSALPCGQLSEPVRIAQRAQLLTERALCMPGESLRAYVSAELLSKVVRRRFLLLHDSPMRAASDQPPEVLLKEGQHICSGDIWLKVSTEQWISAPRKKTPPLIRAWAGILEKDTSNYQQFSLERVPPGISGQVVSIQMERNGGAFGLAFGWRVSVEVIEPVGHHADISLPDGRLAAVAGILLAHEAPFCEHGNPVQVLIEDPAFSFEMASNESWFDAASGDLLLAKSHATVHWVARDDVHEITPADPHLRYGLIDGSGLAANALSPAFCAAERQWLAAAHPNFSAQLNAVEHAWHVDTPAYWSRLLLALDAGHTDAPKFGPSAWQTPLSQRPIMSVSNYDPIRTQLKNIRSQYVECENFSDDKSYESASQKQPDLLFKPYLLWACECGELLGHHRALEQCDSCQTPVLRRREQTARIAVPSIELRTTVLHPWYREECATLLGLLPDEYDSLLQSHGGPHVVEAIAHALHSPARSIEARINRCEGSTKAALQRNYQRLTASLGTLHSHIFLDRVPLVAPVLRPAGLPTGAPDVLVSPIIGKYQNLRLANSQFSHTGSHAPDWLKADAWIAMQDAVNDLFGPLEDPQPGYATIAALTQRILPTTRRPDSRHVIPGTFRAFAYIQPAEKPAERSAELAESDRFKEQFAWAAAFRGELTSQSALTSSFEPCQQAQPGIVTEDGPTTLPVFQEQRRPLDPAFWTHRFYRSLLLERYLPMLAAILGRLDHDQDAADFIRERTTCALTPRHVENLGAVLLREFVRALDQELFSASAFYELLTSQLPLKLPSDPQQAEARFVERLLFNDSPSPELKLVQAGLFYIFGNWQLDESASCWQWKPLHKKVVKSVHRATLPLSSVAWDDWPDIDFGRAPVRWFRNAPSKFTSTICAQLHWNTVEIPEFNNHQTDDLRTEEPLQLLDAQPAQETEQSAVIPNAFPAQTEGEAFLVGPEKPDQEALDQTAEIRVLDVSPLAWLAFINSLPDDNPDD